MDRNAYLDSSYINTAAYGSCYRAECIAANGCTDTKFGLRVNFNKTVFLHALLMVLDINSNSTVNSWDIYCIAEDGTETLCGTYDTSVSFGFEGWLNKEVASIRIVGNPADPTNWDVKICMLGPMGTRYVHLTPVLASVCIQQGQQAAALNINHI